MLLEGLSPKEVCRLQYEDFVQLPDSVYYSLRVLRPFVTPLKKAILCS